MGPSGAPAQAIRHLTDLTIWHEATFISEGTKNFNSTALSGLEVTRSAVGHMSRDFPVVKSAQNEMGNLHEGCLDEATRNMSVLLRVVSHVVLIKHYARSYTF